MSLWTQVALLARREFVQRVTSKAFRVTMPLLTVAILAVGPIVSLVAGGPAEATKIGLVGEEIPGIEQEMHAQAALFDMEIEVTRFATRAEAESALADGSVALDPG